MSREIVQKKFFFLEFTISEKRPPLLKCVSHIIPDIILI